MPGLRAVGVTVGQPPPKRFCLHPHQPMFVGGRKGGGDGKLEKRVGKKIGKRSLKKRLQNDFYEKIVKKDRNKKLELRKSVYIIYILYIEYIYYIFKSCPF